MSPMLFLSASLYILGATIALLCLTLLRDLYFSILRPRWFLRHLPGPPHQSYLAGHMGLVDEKPAGVQHTEWYQQYGSMAVYDGYMKIPRISVCDEVALRYVLQRHAYDFPKPLYLRRLLGQIFGIGIVVAEGSDHMRQRKFIMSVAHDLPILSMNSRCIPVQIPLVGASHTRKAYPVILEKTRQLCDQLRQKISEDTSKTQTQVEVLQFTSRISLDANSIAAFGHDTNTLAEGGSSPLANAFHTLANSIESFGVWHAVVNYFPLLKIFDHGDRAKAANNALEVMGGIGTDLVSDRQRDVQAGKTENRMSKDLLGALVRANSGKDVQPHAKLSDYELTSQINTILLAGSESTASGLLWTLHALSNNEGIQSKLRDEIAVVADDEPTVDQLNALPYLDAVIRESLRLHPPISSVLRTAEKDTVVPLSKPIIGNDGRMYGEIRVARGTNMFIPIAALNRREDTWGPDASTFNPERFIEGRVPLGATQLPSAAFPTFITGARVCIGWRFAMLEMKTVIFHLIRRFDFLPAVSPDQVLEQANFITRPRLLAHLDEGYQLPIIVRSIQRDQDHITTA